MKKPKMIEITEYPCGCISCKDKIIKRCPKHENYGNQWKANYWTINGKEVKETK